MIYAITHNDLDGIGCAILLEKVHKDIQTYAIDYREVNQVLPDILKKAGKGEVFITDISLNELQAELCNKHSKYGKISHIDHHSSSKKLMDKYPWSFTDISHCATYHLFKMLSIWAHLDDYKEFVDLVDSYDTWGHGTEPSEAAYDLNRLLQMIGAETFVARFKLSGSIKLSETEKAIIATDKFKEEQYLQYALRRAQRATDKNGNDFLIVAAEDYTSSLGHFLLQAYNDIEYVIILNMLKDKASLRSKGKVNVDELAKACGGGGHPKAAGFQLNDAAINNFWRGEDNERGSSGNTDMDR